MLRVVESMAALPRVGNPDCQRFDPADQAAAADAVAQCGNSFPARRGEESVAPGFSSPSSFTLKDRHGTLPWASPTSSWPPTALPAWSSVC